MQFVAKYQKKNEERPLGDNKQFRKEKKFKKRKMRIFNSLIVPKI